MSFCLGEIFIYLNNKWLHGAKPIWHGRCEEEWQDQFMFNNLKKQQKENGFVYYWFCNLPVERHRLLLAIL